MNLQDLCIDNIAANFERYLYNQDLYNEQDLKYLQKTFSLELLSALSLKDKLAIKKEFVDILVNKYLNAIETCWFENCSWDQVTSKIAEIGQNIEEIVITQSYSTPRTKPWHDLIRHLPNLKRFKFHDGCYDVILKKVAEYCPNIEEIDTGWLNQLTGIKYICQDEKGKALCTNLKNLYCLSIKDEDLKYLVKQIPSLTRIWDDYRLPYILYSLHENDLSCLDKVKPYNFVTLDISDTELKFNEDYFKICLSVCPNLKFLKCMLGSKHQIDYLLPYLPEVEKLDIYFDPRLAAECNISDLLRFKGGKLTDLHLNNCTVSASVLFKSCSILEVLCLSGVRFLFEKNSNPEFHSLFHLSLEIYNNSWDDGICRFLSSLSKQIKLLVLELRHFSSSELKLCLLRCCERNPIQSLLFINSSIEKEFLKQVFSRCHSLQVLAVDRCFEDSDTVELLTFAKTLPSKPEVFTDIGEAMERSYFGRNKIL